MNMLAPTHGQGAKATDRDQQVFTKCTISISCSTARCCAWQEVSVGGQDVVYKDIIEPLESVSVSITPSDKDDITLYGEPVDVSMLQGARHASSRLMRCTYSC